MKKDISSLWAPVLPSTDAIRHVSLPPLRSDDVSLHVSCMTNEEGVSSYVKAISRHSTTVTNDVGKEIFRVLQIFLQMLAFHWLTLSIAVVVYFLCAQQLNQVSQQLFPSTLTGATMHACRQLQLY
eukprot:COSAG01_NODE_931_length_12617_cov_20.567163_10_plen_126_part_00